MSREIGDVLNCKEDTTSWENSVACFKSASTLSMFDPSDVMDVDAGTPPIARKADDEHDRNISSNERSKKDWKKASQDSKQLSPLWHALCFKRGQFTIV